MAFPICVDCSESLKTSSPSTSRAQHRALLEQVRHLLLHLLVAVHHLAVLLLQVAHFLGADLEIHGERVKKTLSDTM